MSLITWTNSNYLTDKDTFTEVQKWMGYVWHQFKYCSTLTLDATASGFLKKPASGTGSAASDRATNAAQILQAIRAHIATIDNLNYDTDLVNQPKHYDASLVLQKSLRTLESGFGTGVNAQAKILADALNAFFVTVKGKSLREWWDDVVNNPTALMSVTAAGSSCYDADFADFWETTRSEALYRTLLTYKVVGGVQGSPLTTPTNSAVVRQMFVKTTATTGIISITGATLVDINSVPTSLTFTAKTINASTSTSKEVRIDSGTTIYIGGTSLTFTCTNVPDNSLVYLIGK
jgi:hypothetical protein